MRSKAEPGLTGQAVGVRREELIFSGTDLLLRMQTHPKFKNDQTHNAVMKSETTQVFTDSVFFFKKKVGGVQTWGQFNQLYEYLYLTLRYFLQCLL